MKIPRKVQICGQDWDVKINPHGGGGEFDGAKYAITIGTLYKKDILGVFLHEVLEAILTERCYRYKIYNNDSNEKTMFVFDHDEFTNIIKDLACSVKGIIKK